jgi:hypothetical protein
MITAIPPIGARLACLELSFPREAITINFPRFDIGGIDIDGPGGITSTFIQGADIGHINIDNGGFWRDE